MHVVKRIKSEKLLLKRPTLRMDKLEETELDKIRIKNKPFQASNTHTLIKHIWTQILKLFQKVLTFVLNLVSSFSYAYFASFMHYMTEAQIQSSTIEHILYECYFLLDVGVRYYLKKDSTPMTLKERAIDFFSKL